jgi:hypothetical protein
VETTRQIIHLIPRTMNNFWHIFKYIGRWDTAIYRMLLECAVLTPFVSYFAILVGVLSLVYLGVGGGWGYWKLKGETLDRTL